MTYSSVVFNDSPALWWQLNDSPGVTVSPIDASGNDITATAYNVQFKTPVGPAVTSMSCAKFNGTSGGYGAGDGSTIQSAYNPDTYLAVSLECWVNFQTVPTSGNPRFIASSNTAVDNYGCELFWSSTTDVLHFSLATSSATGTATCAWTPIANTWYHLVATWDGTIQYLYINGVQEGSASFTPTSPTMLGTNPASARLGFGCGYPVTYTSGDMFAGLMSNVAVYDYNLATAQVVAHYTGISEIPAPVPFDTYTVNLCPNPSFINNIAGYTALPNTGIAPAPGVSFTGRQSMVVETDGIASGEGVLIPSGIVPYFSTGSIQLQLLGAVGDLTVAVYTHPSAVSPLSSVPVTLNSANSWQPIVINGLPLYEGQELFVTVTTSSPQILMFWVDCVQYEAASPSHAYIDGSQPFCEWTGLPGNSPSFQQFQFPMGANGSMNLSGRTVIPVNVGASFSMSASSESMQLYSVPPYILSTAGVPVGAFTDFAFYQLTDVDPALSYVSWNNAGTSSGETSYNRIYGLVSAPVAYEVSGNGELWAGAQYLASGYQFTSLGAAQIAEITQLQAELLPYQYGTAPTPSTYDTPRAVHTIIKPTRMNYCPNPSGAVSTSGWYLLGSASTLAQSSSGVTSSAVSGALDAYSVSAHIISTSGVDGLGISIADLILGDTYVVSAWVMTPSAGFLDVTASCSGGQASSFQQGTAYGTGVDFNVGPYGGVNVETDMTSGTWYNPTFTFVAEYSTVQLYFQPIIDTTTFTSPVTLNVDAVMVEPTDIAGTYFDGGFSPSTDYMWETGGTAGLARSYYYQRYGPASASVATVLNEATPLGISHATPLFATPPTQ